MTCEVFLFWRSSPAQVSSPFIPTFGLYPNDKLSQFFFSDWPIIIWGNSGSRSIPKLLLRFIAFRKRQAFLGQNNSAQAFHLFPFYVVAFCLKFLVRMGFQITLFEMSGSRLQGLSSWLNILCIDRWHKQLLKFRSTFNAKAADNSGLWEEKKYSCTVHCWIMDTV